MAKDEEKKEKKSKRKSEGADTEMGDVSVMTTSSEKKVKKEKKDKKEKKVKSEDGDADMDEDAVTKGEVSPEAISPIARESIHPVILQTMALNLYYFYRSTCSKEAIQKGVQDDQEGHKDERPCQKRCKGGSQGIEKG